MKIAMIGQKGVPAHSGGVEQHVDVLSQQLAERGHDVTVYCRRWYDREDRSRPPHPLVRRVFRPTIPTKHFDAITHAAISTLDVALRRADVVHYHAIGPAALAPLSRLAGLRVVVTVHGLDWQRAKWGPTARRCLQGGEWLAGKSASRVVVVSPVHQEYFERAHGVRATFVPNGVMPLARREPGRMLSMGIVPGRYVLAVARLVREKGLHYLVDAFRRVPGDWQLVIAGGGGFDSDYEANLRRCADNRVIFTGPADRELLEELYSHARLFALPSDLEGMSIALLEAMSLGLPVLVSDIPENTVVVEDAGVSFRAGDRDSLADTLNRLLVDDHRLNDLGERARLKSLPYQWSNVVERLEEVYGECAPPRVHKTSDSRGPIQTRTVEHASVGGAS